MKSLRSGVNRILEPVLLNMFDSISGIDIERMLFQFTGEAKLSEVSDPIENKIKMIHIDFDSLEEIVPFTKVILFSIRKLILGGKF